MRVLLRADAGHDRGTGHVMRCLTLAEGLVSREHDVALMGAIDGVGWLAAHLAATGIEVIGCETDELDAARIARAGFDRAVVDSYWIDPAAIAALDDSLPTLAIIDNTDRGIQASWYLDQNLGAEDRSWPAAITPRLLAGSDYALIRDAILAERRPGPGSIDGRRPRVVVFMGGTDPGDVMVEVAASIAASRPAAEVIAITVDRLVERVTREFAPLPAATVLPPTDDLPRLLGSADVVVSAAGTSAWDVCAMGLPAVLVAVVDNQRASLAQALDRGVALGLDGTAPGAASETGRLLTTLLDDADLRRRLSSTALRVIDGRGKDRVAAALEGDAA